MDVLQIRMYSLRELPNSLRGTFELPAWPYYNGIGQPPPPEFVKYLMDLGVVRYQDDYEKFPYGILIDNPDFSFRDMKPTLARDDEPSRLNAD